jgi:hypothetical protein
MPSVSPGLGSSLGTDGGVDWKNERMGAGYVTGTGQAVDTTDLIYSEERQIFLEVFLSRHVYRHMSEKLRTILECHSQHD